MWESAPCDPPHLTATSASPDRRDLRSLRPVGSVMTVTARMRGSVGALSPLRFGIAVVTVIIIEFALTTWMFWDNKAFSIQQLKLYANNDQASYLAISTNVQHGNFRAIEPFTETGHIYFPRLYYQFIGLIARIFHTDLVSVWWVVGIGAQCLLVALLSAACMLLTRRTWTAFVPPLLTVVGTYPNLGITSGGGGWDTPLQRHATLYGPFGMFYATNGMSFAVCLSAGLFVALLLISKAKSGRRVKIIGPYLCAGLLGVLAYLDTYTFLISVFVAAYVLACLGIGAMTRRWRTILAVASLVLLGLTYVIGPIIATKASPLTTLMSGLVAAAPGVLALIAKYGRRVLGPILTCGFVALPQVAITMYAAIQGDAFLTYRQSSSRLLGVPIWEGLIHGVVLISMLLVLVAVGVIRREALWIAVGTGSLIAWFLMWTNDLWGANQEPYQQWITGNAILLAAAGPYMLSVVADSANIGPLNRWRVRVPHVLLAGWLVVALGSLQPYAIFSSRHGYIDRTINFHTPQLTAATEVAQSASLNSSLLLSAPCIVPNYIKMTTGLPIAWEALGIAWAERHDALRSVLAQRSHKQLVPSSLRQAGVTHVLTDSTCVMKGEGGDAFTTIGMRTYATPRGTATVRLLALRP